MNSFLIYKILRTSLLALLIGITGCSNEKEVTLSPEQALNEFYTNDGAEDQLMDPLIIAGQKVVPILLKEIEDKNMTKRRYAIGALGNIRDTIALPTLEKILSDETEESYFRCDALNSIGMIAFDQSKELAKRYVESSISCLASKSREILTSDYESWITDNYMTRSLEDARSGKHN